MSSAGSLPEGRIDEIIRRYNRQQLKFYAALYLLPSIGLISALLFDWILRLGPGWAVFRFWMVEGPYIGWGLLLLMLANGRPRFVRDFIFGLEPQLSDEEKAQKARDEEIRRQFDRLIRPLDWLMRLAFYGCVFTLVFWWVGDITMTTELAIATTLLGLMAALSVWARGRIYQAYYPDSLV
jgi:hypothetical protein